MSLRKYYQILPSLENKCTPGGAIENYCSVGLGGGGGWGVGGGGGESGVGGGRVGMGGGVKGGGGGERTCLRPYTPFLISLPYFI